MDFEGAIAGDAVTAEAAIRPADRRLVKCMIEKTVQTIN
jgi:hypothetical protein